MLEKRDRLLARSLKKREPSKRHIQKQVKSSNRSWTAKNLLFSESKKVKQLHSEIPKLKLLSSESTKKKLMWKITWNKPNQTFSPEKFETKAINILVLCC